MAFKVKFYSFSKKENSTAQPSGGTEYDCQIKRESGLINPEIILNIGLSGAPAGWNYAYIADFSRYYFIREWINEGPIWRAVMQCDVLASYKAAIGSSTLYALRSSHSYDGNIIDALYPCKANPDYNITNVTPPFIRTATTGLFVCGIVASSASAGSTTAQIGSLKYYYMDLAGLSALCSALLDNANYPGYGFTDQDCSYELQKSLIEPLQYIKSCVWIPANAADAGVTLSNQTLYINGWSVQGIHCAAVPQSGIVLIGNRTVTIPTHPDAASRGNYMNFAPYTGLSISVPPYGDFDADVSMLSGETTLYINEYIDVTNGKGIIDIFAGQKKTLAHLSALRGVNIQLSQITTDHLGAVTSGVGGIAGAIGAALLGNVAGAIGSVVGGIANAAKASAPKMSTMGGGGSFMENYFTWYVVFKFMRPVADDNAHHGRPLCRSIQISNYPGYLLIQDADIAISATAEELQKIRAYLEGGFYYE